MIQIVRFIFCSMSLINLFILLVFKEEWMLSWRWFDSMNDDHLILRQTSLLSYKNTQCLHWAILKAFRPSGAEGETNSYPGRFSWTIRNEHRKLEDTKHEMDHHDARIAFLRKADQPNKVQWHVKQLCCIKVTLKPIRLLVIWHFVSFLVLSFFKFLAVMGSNFKN